MADFEVDLPPVPDFKPMNREDVIYRSDPVVSNMDMDKVKKHLRSFTRKMRYFTSVGDVRQSVTLSALSRNKQKLVASNQFNAGARAQQEIDNRKSMKVGARQESANLYLDINKYNEVERRLNGLMEESAEMEQYDKVRTLIVLLLVL